MTFPAVPALAVRDRAVGFDALDKSVDSAALDKSVDSAVPDKAVDFARGHFAVLDLAVPAMERFAAREFAALGKAADSAALDKSADFAVLHKAADSARARLFVRDFAVPDKVVRDRTVLGTAADPARKVSAVPDLDVLPARKGLVLHLLYSQAQYCRFLLPSHYYCHCQYCFYHLYYRYCYHYEKIDYRIPYLFVHSFCVLHDKYFTA